MAIALVSNVSQSLSGTSGSINTTGSTFIVAIIAWTNTGVPQPTMSDSKSNVWNPYATSISSGTDTNLMAYLAINPTVGSGHTFTLSGSLATMCVAAFSGTATSFPISKTSAATNTSVTSIAAGSLTPEVDNCVAITALSNRVNTTYAVSGGFAITDQLSFIAGTRVGSALAYLVQTTAAAANPSWSWTGAGSGTAITVYVQPPPVSGVSGGGSFPFC